MKSWLEKNDVEMYLAHNEAYHSTISIKLVDLKSITYIDFLKEITKKVLNLN